MIRLSGEISTKSRRTRARFQRILVDNLRDACRSAGWSCRIRDEWSRLYLRTDGEEPGPLGRVFGISTFSRIEAECGATLPAIVRVGTELFGERVRWRTYAVRARRTGQHDFRSREIMERLGAALNEHARVDLDDPEVEVYVEVRDATALLFSERVAGAGGLPL
jgi:thiamine biosynthesis protein ThiI